MPDSASTAYLQSLFSLEGKKRAGDGRVPRGSGAIISEALVRAGASVIIASRKVEVCEECAAELNAAGSAGSAVGIAGDVSSETGVAALAEAGRDAVSEAVDSRQQRRERPGAWSWSGFPTPPGSPCWRSMSRARSR
jgi:hypothetical protein